MKNAVLTNLALTLTCGLLFGISSTAFAVPYEQTRGTASVMGTHTAFPAQMSIAESRAEANLVAWFQYPAHANYELVPGSKRYHRDNQIAKCTCIITFEYRPIEDFPFD